MILKSVRNNKIESFFIVSIFIIFITLIIYFICEYYLELGYFSILIALMFSFISAFASYYNSDKIILSMSNARPANEEEDKLLSSILDNLCIASGLPKPKLYIIDDDSPNAFATGRDPSHAVICFTSGIIQKLDKYELEGVMGHELSHIKNYDILLSTIVSVFVGMVVMLADVFTRVRVGKSSSKNNANGIIMILGLIALILSPIFATLMQLAISRKREYLADASSVEITRNPEGLISALKKLNDDKTILKSANKSTAHMFIVDPLKRIKDDGLYATHPPIEKRIERLQNIN